MTQTSRQAEAVRIWRETGSKAEVGRQLGISYRNAHSLIDRALAHEVEPDGVTEALEKAAAQGADTVWLKSKEASIKWTRPKPEADPLAFLEAIKAGLTDVPRAGHVDAPSGPSDLMAVFPVADLHMGLLTEAREVGVEWNNDIAKATFRRVFATLVDRTPAAGTALLAQLGDLLHSDNQSNVTRRSGHQLDVAKRHYSNVEDAVELMAWAIDTLRAKFPRVVFRAVAGNHDPDVLVGVTLALRERYRDCKNVAIHHSDKPIHVFTWGRNMVVLLHGDKTKAERLAHFVAMKWSVLWGVTTYRVAYSGHWHKFMDTPVGGLMAKTIGTIIPGDFYAASSAYGSPREMAAFVLRRSGGQASSVNEPVA